MNDNKTLPILLFLIFLSGCSISQEKRAIDVYDFGLPAQPARQALASASVQVQKISAPAWLATPDLHYRLAYHDAARLQTYANSRWAADPAALLALRLRQTFGTAPHANQQYQMHLGLEEFSQVFDTPESSRGLIRVHASLTAIGEARPVAERILTVEKKAPSPNAEGGVRALTDASNQLADELVSWVNETATEARKKK